MCMLVNLLVHFFLVFFCGHTLASSHGVPACSSNCGCTYDGGDCCTGTVMKDGELTGNVKTNWWFVVSFSRLVLVLSSYAYSSRMLQRNTASLSLSRGQSTGVICG